MKIKPVLIFVPVVLAPIVPLAWAHTADYLQGYKVGQMDGKTGIDDPGYHGKTPLDAQAWLQGYKDGHRSVCGDLRSRRIHRAIAHEPN